MKTAPRRPSSTVEEPSAAGESADEVMVSRVVVLSGRKEV
jgi:hypothetical protein